MRASLIIMVLSVSLSVTLSQEEAIAPLPEDEVIPEPAEIVAPHPKPDAVPEEVLAEAGAESKRQHYLDISDDESDHEAMKHTEADILGRNIITGAKMSKGNNGMSDTHLRYDPAMGRNFVKTPGYTTHDASLTPGGPDVGGGKYYLGSGRRRIGAGFGRRRRQVELPESKAQKADDKARQSAIFKDPTKMKALLHFAHQRSSHYGEDEIKDRATTVANLKSKAAALTKHLTHAQLLRYAREMMGIHAGPTFYEHNNYGGTSLTTSTSVADLGATKVGNNDLSSIKVPAGYVVVLYTKKNYEGQSLQIAGPTKIWGLKSKPLTLHSGLNSGGGGGKMSVTSGYRSYHTTWADQAASIKITKYEYVVFPPKQKCYKYCGVANYEYTGAIGCKRSGGLQSKKVVGVAPNGGNSNSCARLKLTAPKVPKRRCKGTNACTNFKTRAPVVTCPRHCGFSGSHHVGKVWCELRHRRSSDPKLPKEASARPVSAGRHVSDGNCYHWRLPRPATPTKTCQGTNRCVKWDRRFTGGCPGSCGQPASYIASTNFCIATADNAAATDAECAAWGIPAPATKHSGCPATAGCPLPSGSCCWLVASAHSATSCARCAGGHHFEWAWDCGGSRGCD